MRRSTLAAGLFSAATMMAIAASPSVADHLDNPNQLHNGGFEIPIADTSDSFVGRWQPFSGSANATAEASAAMPRTGAGQLDLSIAGDANSFTGAFQDVPVSQPTDGRRWWLSGFHKLLSGLDGGVEIRVEFLDDAGAEISRTPNTVPVLTSDYEEFIISDTFGPGVATARVVYAIQSFGGPSDQNVLVDDLNFNFEPVPEPASASLAALCGLALAGRRRRK